MRKLIVGFFLVAAVFASLVFAYSDKYQIYSEKKGLFGWGGKITILLDRETGDSWIYSGNKWVAIPKVSEEVEAKAEPSEDQAQEASRIEDELNALKAKQAEEFDQLKARQEAEFNALKAKQESELKTTVNPEQNKNTSSSGKTYYNSRRGVKPQPKPIVEKKAAPTEPDDASSAPAWLTE